MPEPQVLIAGAGPTGLVLALRLANHGVPIRIVSKAAGPGEASRAMAVQARTLEFYQQLGFGDAVVADGIRIKGAHLREHGHDLAAIAFDEIGRGVSPYPFVLSYPQDDHERFLTARLAERGVTVEWNTALTGFEARGDGVLATLDRGGTETCEVAYLAGCDGAHSVVREQLGVGFPGGTYDQLFYVADVALEGAPDDELLVQIGDRSLVLALPIRSTGMHRLIGIVPPELGGRRDIGFEDVRPSAEALLGIRAGMPNWFSSYRVHHRVVDHFRRGRVFLAGDAAHLHSPAGGQGMNTGIGDAVNLAWKLGDVLQGRVGAAVLDTYETERIAFARKLVATTDRAFETLVGEGWTSTALRQWVLPGMMPLMANFAATRRLLFNTVSQTRIHYRDSALSEGRAGTVHGGDRLPWTGANYAMLDGRSWRLHCYGEVPEGVAPVAAALGIAVDALPFDKAADAAGFIEGAAYLLRPDGHVAIALPDRAAERLAAYAARIGLQARD